MPVFVASEGAGNLGSAEKTGNDPADDSGNAMKAIRIAYDGTSGFAGADETN